MKRTPKISVIMAVYNGEKYLAEAIESILNQTFKNFEFIIVDDCSKDNSLNVIKDFAKKDNRIKIIFNKKNLKLPASLNKGLKIAKGKYIARMDADDISLPERFEVQYNFLEEHQEIFLIGGGAININEDNKFLYTFHPQTNLNRVKRKLSYLDCFYHPTIMFRNERIIKYREKFIYAQDYDFYLNLLSKKKKITNIKDILIKYRINTNFTSFSRNAKQFLFAEKAKEFYRQRIKYGKDDYISFDNKEILECDVNKLNDPNLMYFEISANYLKKDMKRVRLISKKIIKIEGIFSKAIICYFLSFFGYKINIFLKNLYTRL